MVVDLLAQHLRRGARIAGSVAGKRGFRVAGLVLGWYGGYHTGPDDPGVALQGGPSRRAVDPWHSWSASEHTGGWGGVRERPIEVKGWYDCAAWGR